MVNLRLHTYYALYKSIHYLPIPLFSSLPLSAWLASDLPPNLCSARKRAGSQAHCSFVTHVSISHWPYCQNHPNPWEQELLAIDDFCHHLLYLPSICFGVALWCLELGVSFVGMVYNSLVSILLCREWVCSVYLYLICL